MDAAGRELIEDEESREPKDGHVARVHMAGVGCAAKGCGSMAFVKDGNNQSKAQ